MALATERRGHATMLRALAIFTGIICGVVRWHRVGICEQAALDGHADIRQCMALTPTNEYARKSSTEGCHARSFAKRH